MMEVRKEELKVSAASDSKPTLRTARFLKPIANEPVSEVPPTASMFDVDYKERPLKIHFKGWHGTQKKWAQWVDALNLKHESLWKKVGIHEAIMSTKYYISKNQDLLFGVVEKWCSETNSFVFAWGEATITLEDIMVLGGYPILGDPVFISLGNHELKEVEKKLILARQEHMRRTKYKASSSAWMDIFIDKGSEIEHEAFLATWLSTFVFPHNDFINKSLFPIAIHLARGNPIALAPAVLASIYKDLSLFKKTIIDLTKHLVALEVTLQSPMYLVQIWLWERFRNLQPEPNLIIHENPLLFRWHKVTALKIDNVRSALNLAVDNFLWRPYVRYGDKFGLFYPKVETWVTFETDLEKEVLSLVTCLRVSELVGIDSIEQYLPHRVAMQFGMDQDVPGCVARVNQSKAIAWKIYCRPISEENLCVPSRYFEAGVTTRYAKWWKQSVFVHHDFFSNIARRKRSGSSSKHIPHSGKANTSCNAAAAADGSANSPSEGDDGLKARKGDDIDAGANGSKIVPSENFVQHCLEDGENIHAGGHTHFPPNIHIEKIQGSSEEYENSEKLLAVTIGGLDDDLEDVNGNEKSRPLGDTDCLSETKGMSIDQRISRLKRRIAERSLKLI